MDKVNTTIKQFVRDWSVEGQVHAPQTHRRPPAATPHTPHPTHHTPYTIHHTPHDTIHTTPARRRTLTHSRHSLPTCSPVHPPACVWPRSSHAAIRIRPTAQSPFASVLSIRVFFVACRDVLRRAAPCRAVVCRAAPCRAMVCRAVLWCRASATCATSQSWTRSTHASAPPRNYHASSR